MDSYRAVETPANARLIFVGDIHGCYDELLELLARVAPAPQDLVVSVGDIVTKGPAVARCLDLWRERGYFAVAGNNELKLLDRATPILRFFARDEVLRRGDLLRYLASWPLVLDFPSRNVAAVHGGFLPGMSVTPADVERERDVVPRLRWIRKKNGDWTYVPKNRKKDGDVLWAEKWKGDRFVLYGHTPPPRAETRPHGPRTRHRLRLRRLAHRRDPRWRRVVDRERKRAPQVRGVRGRVASGVRQRTSCRSHLRQPQLARAGGGFAFGKQSTGGAEAAASAS